MSQTTTPSGADVLDDLEANARAHRYDGEHEIAAEFDKAHTAVAALIARNAGLEKLRPVWAEGWSDDSVAAQCSAAALSQLWELLGVTDQTAAIIALRKLNGAQP